MAPIPDLLTDNLYKFLALSGLALVLFSASFPPVVISRVHERMERIEAELVPLRVDLNAVKREVARLQQSPTPTTVEVAAIQSRLDQREVRHELLALKLTSLKRAVRYLNRLIAWMIAGLSTGITMALAGFWLWYKRLQVHQDTIVRLEAAAAAGRGQSS